VVSLTPPLASSLSKLKLNIHTVINSRHNLFHGTDTYILATTFFFDVKPVFLIGVTGRLDSTSEDIISINSDAAAGGFFGEVDKTDAFPLAGVWFLFLSDAQRQVLVSPVGGLKGLHMQSMKGRTVIVVEQTRTYPRS
jgi:hypothetical protein